MEKQNSIEIWSGLSLNDRATCEGDARRRKKLREAKAKNGRSDSWNQRNRIEIK